MHRLSLDDDRKGGEGERENGDDDGGNGNGNDLTPTWLTSTGYGCVIILRKYEEIDRLAGILHANFGVKKTEIAV